MTLRFLIRTIHDYSKPDIQFPNTTTLLRDPKRLVAPLPEPSTARNYEVDAAPNTSPQVAKLNSSSNARNLPRVVLSPV